MALVVCDVLLRADSKQTAKEGEESRKREARRKEDEEADVRIQGSIKCKKEGKHNEDEKGDNGNKVGGDV